jgi:hypothetical protein
MITPNSTILLAMLALATAAGVQTTESPFFCNLKALTPAERAEHLGLTARMLPAIRESREISDGYTFELDAHRVAVKDLATWVDFERRCCPFFDFQIDWRRENGPLMLQLTGRTGVKEFIRSEFKAAFH